MKKARILFILLIFPAAFANADASMVSFYIIETGLPDNDGGSVHQHSVLWENAFMDVFFDAGFIVGNAPILRLEKKPSGDILKNALINLNDAREWGIDYILIAQLDYINESQIPGNVSFYIYTVSPEKKVYEKQINRNSNRMTKDEFDELKTIVRGLVPFIQ